MAAFMAELDRIDCDKDTCGGAEVYQEYSKKYKKKLRSCLLHIQRFECAVCGRKLLTSWDQCLDHDHKTGMPRGVLCHYCNTGLGFYLDNPALLRKAAEYLEKTVVDRVLVRVRKAVTNA